MTEMPLHPKHPERICWGCEKLCPADDLRCGNGSERAQHPAELFGDDWYEWSQRRETSGSGPNASSAPGDLIALKA